MAIPIARVHLKMAHAALPALLPTPPKWKMLPPLLQTPCPCVAAIVLPKPIAKPSRADTDERWDARKAKPACPESTAPSSLSGPRKNTTSPPPKPGRADSVESWDAHKKAVASPASSPSSSCLQASGSSAARHPRSEKRCPPQAKLLDDDESSSHDIDDTEEEEILWKPRAMYAGPGFVVAAPESSLLPMPTAFLIPVA